jgi:hypothetical protein
MMQKLRFDAIRRGVLQRARSMITARARSARVGSPELPPSWRGFDRLAPLLDWIDATCRFRLDDHVGLEQAEQIRDVYVTHALMPACAKRSRAFLIESGLIRQVLCSSLSPVEGEQLRPPFPAVYVEPTQPIVGILPQVRLVGFMYAEFYIGLEEDRYVFGFGPPPERNGVHLEHAALFQVIQQDSRGPLATSQVVSKRLIREFSCSAPRAGGRQNAIPDHFIFFSISKLLAYLTSSNVGYELIRREPPSKAKRWRGEGKPKPYYVTHIRRAHVSKLAEQPGCGATGRLTTRFEVRGHFYTRWYCPTCNTVNAIARFLAGGRCRGCGAALADPVRRHFWQSHHWKGPDMAERAHRAYYRVAR